MDCYGDQIFLQPTFLSQVDTTSTYIMILFILFCNLLFIRYFIPLHGVTRHQSSMIYRINPYQYVHDTFRSNNYTTMNKWTSKEPRFVPISYELKDNILWNKNPVCQKDSFILLMYFVHKKDVERRQVIREYVKQSMVVDGKKLNYVFVVASPLNDTQMINALKEENLQYGDILISLHEDNYRLVPITILDAFYWVREYCKTVSFVARIDGDVWVHLGNLIHYLRGIPQKGVLAGSLRHIRNGRTIDYKGVTIIPYDCPHRIVYVDGGAYIVSRDVVPYISIGAQYLSVLFPVSEDVIVTEALLRAGIHVYPSSQNRTIIVTYRRGMIIPPNTIFLHRIKDISLFKFIYVNHSDVYLSPFQSTSCVC